MDLGPACEQTSFFDIGGRSLHVALLAKRLGGAFPGKGAILRPMDVISAHTFKMQVDLLKRLGEEKGWLKTSRRRVRGTATAGAVETGDSSLDETDSLHDEDMIVITDAQKIRVPRTLPGTDDRRRVAVIGLAVRYPLPDGLKTDRLAAAKCGSLNQMWSLLAAGKHSGTNFGRENKPFSYVLPENAVESFDYGFFGMTKNSAMIVDPNHRLFLELCYEALLNAGQRPSVSAGSNPSRSAVAAKTSGQKKSAFGPRLVPRETAVIGASASLPSYLTEILPSMFADGADTAAPHWLHNLRVEDPASYWRLEVGNDKDYLATRVAHLLNLHGPAKTVQSACSSGLLAISEGIELLRSANGVRQALCGGVSVFFPQGAPETVTQTGMVWSEDGLCKSFDGNASGTANANAGAVVLLKRLEDAIQDQDHIYCVVDGVGVNNDGGEKHSFDAPSEAGQVGAIRAAQSDWARSQGGGGKFAEDVVPPVSYVECHGTGTKLGDPIEIGALVACYGREGAWSSSGRSITSLTIGSAKANIGHANTAAGAIGFCKMALQLKLQKKVPLCHFRSANPLIGHFEGLEFPTVVGEWKSESFIVGAEGESGMHHHALTGAVSSFGIGGTNVHVVMSEHSRVLSASSGNQKTFCGETFTPPLLVSGSCREAVAVQRDLLVEHFRGTEDHVPPGDERDAFFTLCFARPERDFRIAAASVEALDRPAESTIFWGGGQQRICFLFPGQGSQHERMGHALYQSRRFPAFRRTIDQISGILAKEESRPLNPLFDEEEEEVDPLSPNERTQLRIFAVSLGFFAVLQEEHGVHPNMVLGHSLGEFAAATVAGVWPLEVAVRLVRRRGELLDRLLSQETGRVARTPDTLLTTCMLSVSGTPAEIGWPDGSPTTNAHPRVELACRNAENRLVFGGPVSDVARFERFLGEKGVFAKRLRTSAAFHTSAVDALVEDMRAEFDRVFAAEFSSEFLSKRHDISIVSSLLGARVSVEDLRSTDYWMRQMREPVDFATAIATARTAASPNSTEEILFVEVGPGRALSQLAQANKVQHGFWLPTNRRTILSTNSYVLPAQSLRPACMKRGHGVKSGLADVAAVCPEHCSCETNRVFSITCYFFIVHIDLIAARAVEPRVGLETAVLKLVPRSIQRMCFLRRPRRRRSRRSDRRGVCRSCSARLGVCGRVVWR